MILRTILIKLFVLYYIAAYSGLVFWGSKLASLNFVLS